MTKTLNALRLGAIAMLASAIGGCSAAPDAAAIREAIANNDRVMQAMEATFRLDAVFTGQSAPSFNELTFERGNCVAATGASGFVCDFRIGRAQPCPSEGTDLVEDGIDPFDQPACDAKPFFGNWTKARFFQANGSWQFEQAQ